MNLPKSYEIELRSAQFIQPIIEGLTRLSALAEQDEAVKSKWEFDLPHRAKDNGLIRQSKGETDNKWLFQYHPFLNQQLEERGVDTSEFTELIKNLDGLYQQCREAVRNVLSTMDALLPGYNFLQRLDEKPDTEQHMLRAILYDADQEVLAHSHTDRGPISLHVAESAPGLRLIEENVIYKAKPNKALVFYGSQANILTNGLLTPTLHQVENTVSNNERRWAIVYFTSIDVEMDYNKLSEIVDSYDAVVK